MLVALVAGSMMMGCGLDWPLTSTLVDQATRSLGQSSGVEVVGAYTQGANRVALDLQINRGEDSEHGNLTVNGTHLEIIVVRGKAYLRGRAFAANLIDATKPLGVVGLQAVKETDWYTSSNPTPVDPGPLFDPGTVRDAFLLPADEDRADGVQLHGQATVELKGHDISAYIQSAPPHHLLRLLVGGPGGPFGIRHADLAVMEQTHSFPIEAPTPVMGIDDPLSMPPYYVVTSVDASQCQPTTCPVSALVQNQTGDSRPGPAASTVTLELLNVETGQVVDSCNVAISPDIAGKQTTRVGCTISRGYGGIDFTYRFVAIPDNPAYD